MDIAPTQTITTTTLPPAATAESPAAAQISSDFEVFLQMLTAQMQYQDPLNPIDSTDYATQLATFSQVEQAVLTNELLTGLSTQLSVGGLSDMASWVGKEARAAAPAYFDGAPIDLFPNPTNLADELEIIVRDAAGEEVQRIPYAQGTEKVVWTGVNADGSPVPDGVYQFEVAGKTNGVVTTQAGVDTYTAITEVRLDATGQTLLVFAGGVTIPSGQVSALRDGAA